MFKLEETDKGWSPRKKKEDVRLSGEIIDYDSSIFYEPIIGIFFHWKEEQSQILFLKVINRSNT